MQRSSKFLIVTTLCLALAVFAAPSARAQGETTPSEEKPAAKSDFTTDLVNDLTRTGKKLVSLAEAVPAEKFSWRPNEEVRRVSEVYMHVVETNLILPSALGAAPPTGLEIPENPFELFQKLEGEITEEEGCHRQAAGVLRLCRRGHQVDSHLGARHRDQSLLPRIQASLSAHPVDPRP